MKFSRKHASGWHLSEKIEKITITQQRNKTSLAQQTQRQRMLFLTLSNHYLHH